MSDQEKCKKRFKGIENFLRRVAFNLGNTPSQTEVKIISCIPIDVTDLQQKIIYLEKQLEESKNADTDANEAVVQTALLPTGFPRPSSRVSGVTKTSYEHFADNTSKPRKSVVSFTCPSVSPKCHMETESRTPDPYTKDHDDPPFVTTACRKALFQKKKTPKKKKVNTHLVYYAQTKEFNNPFNNTEPVIPKLRTPKKEIDAIGRSFLTDIVRRQYRPSALNKFSDTTQFSSPICRDLDPNQFKPFSKESDICSCCHGPFQNIDNQRTHDFIFPNQLLTDETHVNDRGAYYDSSLYDLIPVKENPIKIKRDTEGKRKDIKRMANIKCWPEHVRPHPRLFTVNYLTHPPNYRRKELANNIIYTKKEIINRKLAERKQVNKVVRNVNMESSNGCIDLGEVYIKPKVKSPNIIEPPTPLQKNAECLTTAINNTECQTITTKSIELVSPPHEDKTEETLNQIKSILQSVLIEVKTNTQLHTNVEGKQKKDAVVQKGPSQSNVMGMSGLLNSFTYSPYNMSPYLSSCSRHMPSNSFCFNGMSPGKCLQNYPLFIQTPGRNMCAGCFRNSSHVNKTDPQHKRAATTATNTEDSNEKHSKETEKLIKEIYKSMALTMDLPTKDTSGSECNEFHNLKSTAVESTEKHDSKVLKEYINSRKENSILTQSVQASQPKCKKDTGINPFYRSRQSPIVATFKTTLPPQDVSKHSQEMSTDTDSQLRKERIGLYLQNTKITPRSTETELGVQDLGAHSPVSTVSEEEEEETESSSSEEDSDDTYVPPKETVTEKKFKKGIFCKMFKSVFKPKEGKNTKDNKEGSVTDESEGSDSDDYQTIYSQRVEQPPKRVVHQPRPMKPHSKIVTTKQPYHKERKPEKRTPYMEQEYRRHWNENLMFHENQKRQYSSEKPVSRKMSPQKKHQSPYYRKYEARSVLHDPYTQYAKEFSPSMQRHNPLPLQVQQHYPPQHGVRQTQPNYYPTPVDNTTVTRVQKTPRVPEKTTAKGMAWLKKHKLGIHCGEQWKKLLLDS